MRNDTANVGGALRPVAKTGAVEILSARRRMISLGYGGYVLLGWNSVLVPALIRQIEHTFGVPDVVIALYYFLTSSVYAIGSFSGGFLTERLGRRVILPLALFLFGIGLGGQAIAPSWIPFLVAALVLNWGAGAIDGGTNGLFLALFTEDRAGPLNFLHLFFSVGALTGPFLAGQVVAAGISWRFLVVGFSVVGVVLSVLLVLQQLPAGDRVEVTQSASGESLARAERSLLPFAGLAVAIALYVAAEMGVTGWLVKFLADEPVRLATGALSIFWVGLALGRLLSNWLADRFNAVAFTLVCGLCASCALLGAVFSPSIALSLVLFGISGMFYGPVYPMLMAIGGDLYPHRLAALSGTLAAAAVVGSVVYPPLMGAVAAHVGIRVGMIGAALLGVPAIIALLYAHFKARRFDTAEREQQKTLAL